MNRYGSNGGVDLIARYEQVWFNEGVGLIVRYEQVYGCPKTSVPSILKQEVFVNDGVVGSKGKSWKIGIIGEKEKLSTSQEETSTKFVHSCVSYAKLYNLKHIFQRCSIDLIIIFSKIS